MLIDKFIWNWEKLYQMKLFKNLFIGVFLITFFIGCNSDETITKEDKQSCMECYMPLPGSQIHTAILIDGKDEILFDDVGCMLLWSQKNKIDVKIKQSKIFANDSKVYIDTAKAHFTINEKTPMLYGFSAYEKPCEKCIDFNEVVIRMARGEHMANPKIRKHILGH